MQVLRRYEPLLHEESFHAARLVMAAREGRREAFDALMRLHEPSLRAFLVSRLGASGSGASRDAVEDVLQETLVSCWRMLPGFRGVSRFRVWLLGIARHKCADYRRGRVPGGASGSRTAESGGELPLSDEIVEQVADPAPSPYAAADLRLLIGGLMRSLPEEQRDVLELYYWGGLTLAEAAETLGRNLNTVKAQFYRAHARAVEYMRLEDGSPPGRSVPEPPGGKEAAGRKSQGNSDSGLGNILRAAAGAAVTSTGANPGKTVTGS